MTAPKAILKAVGSMIINIIYLYRALAPLGVIGAYVRDCLKSISLNRRYKDIAVRYQNVSNGLEFSADWFSHHIPVWSNIFHEFDFASRRTVRALEIGSYEGRSSVFLLSTLGNANLTCVDAWDCSAYRLRGRSCDQEHMTRVEARFDLNLKSFSDRLVKERMTSRAFFSKHLYAEKFDFIYVDGPHYSDDVLIDAINSFDLLEVGGILVFDDYLWRRYARILDNPAAAVNCFLRLKRNALRVVSVTSQLIIQKTDDSIEVVTDD